MYEGVGNAVDAMFKAMVFLIVVFVPLGLWKLVDILIWLYRNVNIEISGGT